MPTKMMSQRLITTFFFLTMNVFNNAYGEIKRTQYFSYVTECANSIKLQDFIEAETLRSQVVSPEILSATNDQEVLHLLHQSIKHLSPLRSEEIIETYARLKKGMVLSDGIKIPPPVEPDNILNFPGCELKTVAVSMQTIDEKNELKNRVIVDKLIWEKLKVYEQVAILLDFALAEEIREENLIPARIFMGYWFSKSFATISDEHWQHLITYLKLPYFEYRGFKVVRFYIDRNTLILYKKSKFKINSKTITVSGKAYFYADTGNLESITEVEPFDFELAPGQWVKAFAADSNHNSESSLKFFNSKDFHIKAGLYKADTPLNINAHTIYPDTLRPYKFSYQSPGVIWNLEAYGAQLKIRNQLYRISSSYNPAMIWFYNNGAISTAAMFDIGQKFDLKNGKQYVVSETRWLDFNCDGFLGPNTDKHCNQSF